MINTPLFKNYRIQEFIQFITNILIIVQRHDAARLKIEEVVSTLSQHHEMLKAAYKKDTLSKVTPQLAQLDAVRDQAIVCLRQVCEGYINYPDEKLSAAGKKIVKCIDKYGTRLYKLNYGAETAALKNLVYDLQTDAGCIQALKALHMEALVQQMHTTNLKFEDLFIERLEEYSEYKGKTTRELTQLTMEAYRTLVQYIEANALLAPSQKYTSLIKHLNENINHYNLVVEKRKRTGETGEADMIANEPTDASVVQVGGQ